MAQEENAMLVHIYNNEYDANFNVCDATRKVPILGVAEVILHQFLMF